MITADGLVEHLGFHAVDGGQVGIEDHAFAADRLSAVVLAKADVDDTVDSYGGRILGSARAAAD